MRGADSLERERRSHSMAVPTHLFGNQTVVSNLAFSTSPNDIHFECFGIAILIGLLAGVVDRIETPWPTPLRGKKWVAEQREFKLFPKNNSM